MPIPWSVMSTQIKNVPENTRVVIIGYGTCPYSAKALKLVAENEIYKDNFLFIRFDNQQESQCFKSPSNFKSKFNYDSTFPVVFVKKQNQMVHIGGAAEFESYLNHI